MNSIDLASKALETVRTAYIAYDNALQRLSVDGNPSLLLYRLGKGLDLVAVCLEFALDDEEYLWRLNEIMVGNGTEERSFYVALNLDGKRVSAYMKELGRLGHTHLKTDDVDVYANAFSRYGEVMKVVKRKSTQAMIRRIADEVLLLTEALAKINNHVFRVSEPSEDELHERLHRHLRPLRSAFHNARCATFPFQEGRKEQLVSAILDWAGDPPLRHERPPVLLMYGNSRSALTTIAHHLAAQARKEGRLLASYFFPWLGPVAHRNPADLIPTIMYQVAKFDPVFLRRIVDAITMDRDVRYKETHVQIESLVARPLRDASISPGSSPIIVIDALDTCDELEVSHVASGIRSFIATLTSISSLRIKVFITCRFTNIVQSILDPGQHDLEQSQTDNSGEMDRIFEQLQQELDDVQQAFKQTNTQLLYRSHILSEAPVHGRYEKLTVSHSDRETLLSLGLAPIAQYDSLGSPTGCLEGTRVDIIAALSSWCTSTTKNFVIYWLVGHAGTGKSTIARTLCDKLAEQDQIMTIMFFASKVSAARRSPFQIIWSFAYQLAVFDAAILRRIVTIIRSNPKIKELPLKELVEELLLSILTDMTATCLVILVIDGLDELVPTHGVEAGTVIRDLAVVLGSLPIRLVATSRMVENLRRVFVSLPTEIVQLHEIEEKSVSHDVRLILTKGFANIVIKHGITASPWPKECDVESLVERTGRFIIFAITVLKYIDSDLFRFSPQRQLQYILEQVSTSYSDDEYEPVDKLYNEVLDRASRRSHDALDVSPQLCARIRALTGTISLLYNPLSISTISQLMDFPEEDVQRDVIALSAVILVGPALDQTGAPVVQIFHPSFRDFIVQRCSIPKIAVNTQQYEHWLSLRCLQILNSTLKRDICDVRDPTLSNSEITPSVGSLVQKYIPATVQYACQFWISHITDSGTPDAELASSLWKFASVHVLHWIECLSLMQILPLAMIQFPLTLAWCKTHADTIGTIDGLRVDTMTLLSDSHRVMLRYRSALETHALQVYYSPQLSMPQCPLLQLARSLDGPLLTSERATQWTNAIMTIEGHTGRVLCVAVSPDGTRIASGSDDMSVRIWDARTGSMVSHMEGHTHSVLSVAFAPDGTRIASGSFDKTIRLWDTQTGREVIRMEGHSGWVQSVAFSPDGAQLVSGSCDKTMKLWDTQTGHGIGHMLGHTRWVLSVAFSPDGVQIASCSSDKSIRVWNTRTTHQVAQFDGHTDWVQCVAFSPDSAHVASCSNDRTVRLWSTRTGLQVSQMEGHTRWVMSIAYSPDGMQVISGSSDRSLRTWNTLTGQELSRMNGHTDWVQSVAISPDGGYIASCSNDQTVRLWNARAGTRMNRREGHTDTINCLVFSPDGMQIASGSRDNTVQIWDSRTGDRVTKMNGHGGSVRSVEFTSDGMHVISSSDDKTVRIWDARNGHQVAQLATEFNIISVVVSPHSHRVTVHSDNASPYTWSVSALPLSERISTSSGSPGTSSSRVLSFHRSTGWIVAEDDGPDHVKKTTSLCWLPAELRSSVFHARQSMIAVASDADYILTIVDFESMLAMLRRLGVLL